VECKLTKRAAFIFVTEESTLKNQATYSSKMSVPACHNTRSYNAIDCSLEEIRFLQQYLRLKSSEMLHLDNRKPLPMLCR
jgi:hypothetical protein